MPRALITGITGQDGSYLAEFLLEKGYEVYGLTRSTSLGTFERIEHLLRRLDLLDGDMQDDGSLLRALKVAHPDEVYNLAAHSFVHRSFGQPIFTSDVTGLGVARILEAIRETDLSIRFYQASSSEMYGNTHASRPRTRTRRFMPASPYAVAKVYGHLLTKNYRTAYGMFATSGILFNHESPRRGLHFVTRKVTDGVARISLGLADKLELGNLDARRDWGYAGDYVEAMWLMLQQDEPDDFVIATGTNHSVRELCELAFGMAGLDYRDHVVIDEANLRPSDVESLVGGRLEGATRAGMDADHRLRDADPDDGRGRHRAPQGTSRRQELPLADASPRGRSRWLRRPMAGPPSPRVRRRGHGLVGPRYRAPLEGAARVARVDVREYEPLAAAIAAARPEALYFLAAVSQAGGRERIADAARIGLVGAIHALTAMRGAGAARSASSTSAPRTCTGKAGAIRSPRTGPSDPRASTAPPRPPPNAPC